MRGVLQSYKTDPVEVPSDTGFRIFEPSEFAAVTVLVRREHVGEWLRPGSIVDITPSPGEHQVQP